MTKHEFKQHILGLSAEGRFPAVNVAENACAYLTPDGRKCVVGVTIPDGHPAQSVFMDAGRLYDTWPELRQHIPEGLTLRDMQRLQDAHDAQVIYENCKLVHTWNHDEFALEVERIFSGLYTEDDT